MEATGNHFGKKANTMHVTKQLTMVVTVLSPPGGWWGWCGFHLRASPVGDEDLGIRSLTLISHRVKGLPGGFHPLIQCTNQAGSSTQAELSGRAAATSQSWVRVCRNEECQRHVGEKPAMSATYMKINEKC